MIQRCAWCGLILGTKPPMEDLAITHGICEPCMRGCLTESEPARTRRNPDFFNGSTHHAEELSGPWFAKKVPLGVSDFLIL